MLASKIGTAQVCIYDGLVLTCHPRGLATSRYDILAGPWWVDGASIHAGTVTKEAQARRKEAHTKMPPPTVSQGLPECTLIRPPTISLTPSPPQKTPAHPRFLLSKRQQPPQSQTPVPLPQKQKQTPTPHQPGPPQPPPPQFASTPRFNVAAATPAPTAASSSRSATVSSHPPIFSTPAPVAPAPSAWQWSTQRATPTPYGPLDDAIETSPISSRVRRSEEARERQFSLNESIEDDSPSYSTYSPTQHDRPTKRRRVSPSPEIDGSPDDEEEEDEYDDDPMEVDDDGPTEEGISGPAAVQDGEDVIETQSAGSPGETEPECSPEPDSPSPAEPSTRHPTFHKAPRFKVAEVAEGAQRGLLPDAFSPQRRGARYVPGGLATELREWLVQVKGASEYDRPARSTVEAVVDEAKSGNGMWLVAAHEKDEAGRPHEGDVSKVLLAGDGRMVGLGGKNMVRPGTTVSFHQPMWDIKLNDLGQFAVACDWEIPE